MATMEPSYHHESNDLPEETYDIYHQPLTYHYEPDYAREPLHYRMQTEQEVDLSSGVLGLLHTKGAIPMAVVVAVGVILVTQYRDDIYAWFAYYFPRDVSWRDSLRVLSLQFVQSIIGWIQYVFSGDILERMFEWACQKDGTTIASPPLQTSRQTGLPRSGSTEALPALELVPILPGSKAVVDVEPESFKTPQRKLARMNREPLQPAFLRDEDYPENWMVYHRSLGVVKKSEAAEYDRRVQETEELSSELEKAKASNFDEEKKDEPPEVDAPHVADLDEDKTVHRSNVSMWPKSASSETGTASAHGGGDDDDESSSSSKDCSSTYPVVHSIAATG